LIKILVNTAMQKGHVRARPDGKFVQSKLLKLVWQLKGPQLQKIACRLIN